VDIVRFRATAAVLVIAVVAVVALLGGAGGWRVGPPGRPGADVSTVGRGCTFGAAPDLDEDEFFWAQLSSDRGVAASIVSAGACEAPVEAGPRRPGD
jgi:hypothetical protein